VTYPANKKGEPFQWDHYDRSTYEVAVVSNGHPIYLFQAKLDAPDLAGPWRRGINLRPTGKRGEASYEIDLETLFVPDNENLNAEPIYDHSFKHFILDELKANAGTLDAKQNLIVEGSSLNDKPCKLQIALVMDDGSSFGKIIELRPELGEHTISLDDLRPVKTVTLPRPYPSFLPYYFQHGLNTTFDINKVESIQFSIGPGIPENELGDRHGISLRTVRLN